MADEAVWTQIETLYRSRFATFERVARGVTGDRETACEAVQDGFADALRHAKQWDGSGSLEAWVWRCVVNRARKARVRQPPIVLETGRLVSDGGHELASQVASLPERQRLVVFLRYFADLDYREIAGALGVSVGTVSATLHAAHAALRSALQEVSA
jgi:DNA-directed RNA polymerase specialized sigma24 family protein